MGTSRTKTSSGNLPVASTPTTRQDLLWEVAWNISASSSELESSSVPSKVGNTLGGWEASGRLVDFILIKGLPSL